MKRVLASVLLAAAVPASAETLHQRTLTLDTHLDTPMHFGRQGWSFGDKHSYETDLVQVDLGRMDEGDLDGGFFVIYTEPGPLTPEGYAKAKEFALGRAKLIRDTLAKFPDRIELVSTADDAKRVDAAGKRFGWLSIENAYPLGEDLSLAKTFYDLGVRMAGPVHSKNSQFADSATDTPKWNGLSPLGRQWVAEMNRLGIVIDGSHSSDAAFDQMIELSKTPLVLSHSGSKTISDQPRNLDDDRIRKLAKSGGVICATTVFLTTMNFTPERNELFGKMERIAEMTPEEQAQLTRETRALDAVLPIQKAGFEDFMRSLLHIIKVAGVDNVCIGGDWDGGGGLRELEDIGGLPKVTERLRAEGFSDADIEKIWSGNVLRVMRIAEQNAAR